MKANELSTIHADQNGDMSAVLKCKKSEPITAVFWSYGNTLSEQFNQVDEAKEFLKNLEDNDNGFAVGVFDSATNTAYITTEQLVIGVSDQEIKAQKIDSIKSLGLIPSKIEYY